MLNHRPQRVPLSEHAVIVKRVAQRNVRRSNPIIRTKSYIRNCLNQDPRCWKFRWAIIKNHILPVFIFTFPIGNGTRPWRWLSVCAWQAVSCTFFSAKIFIGISLYRLMSSGSTQGTRHLYFMAFSMAAGSEIPPHLLLSLVPYFVQ